MGEAESGNREQLDRVDWLMLSVSWRPLMSAVHWGLLVIGLFGLLTSSVFLGMVLIGARRFRREALRESVRLGERPEFLPAISLFKPLHGDEVGLETNLRTF